MTFVVIKAMCLIDIASFLVDFGGWLILHVFVG